MFSANAVVRARPVEARGVHGRHQHQEFGITLYKRLSEVQEPLKREKMQALSAEVRGRRLRFCAQVIRKFGCRERRFEAKTAAVPWDMHDICSNDKKMFLGDGASSLTPQNARPLVPKCETKKNLCKRPAAQTCMLKLHRESTGGVKRFVVAMQFGASGLVQVFSGPGHQDQCRQLRRHGQASVHDHQDNAPSHLARESLRHYARNYPTGGIQEHPPCSPDLKQLDFTFWPRMTSKMLDMPRPRTNVQMRAKCVDGRRRTAARAKCRDACARESQETRVRLLRRTSFLSRHRHYLQESRSSTTSATRRDQSQPLYSAVDPVLRLVDSRQTDLGDVTF